MKYWFKSLFRYKVKVVGFFKYKLKMKGSFGYKLMA